MPDDDLCEGIFVQDMVLVSQRFRLLEIIPTRGHGRRRGRGGDSRATMDEEFEDDDFDTIRDVTSRMGLADVREFVLRWEDCEGYLSRLHDDLLKLVA